METITGRTLGPYRLTRLLARGGMSDIYLASHEPTGQARALKVVDGEEVEWSLRVQREVRMLKALKHPHILPLLDAGKQDTTWYYAMPYIAGGSLKERLAAGPLGLDEVGVILEQSASALQFFHTRGFIHRDIKPGNILLDKTNHAWLADFGLAKAIEGRSDLTATGCLIGTPFYMAPELIEKPASASSDIYALGVVLYEMLTGARPFAGENPVGVCWKQVHESPPLPSMLNPSIFPALEQVLLRALAKNPLARFATAQELAEAYTRALTLLDVGKTTEMIALESAGGRLTDGKTTLAAEAPPQKRQPVRQRAVAAAVALLLLVLGAALGGLTNHLSAPLLTRSAVHLSNTLGHVASAAAAPSRQLEQSMLLTVPFLSAHQKHHQRKKSASPRS